MSDETEQRACDEDFGSEEEADVESYLEDNSGDLMDRLRELEAENSALLLANESQREAYERCLDEVANHVVQALLNQKDLREECIKLKMLVFDLERQNRALCELFQQKLPNQPAAHFQVQTGPLPEFPSPLHNDAAKLAEPPQTEAQTKGNGFRTQHASPGPRGPAASMEALSPFFKKKAHILEVLRKMEETDPLKFHPSTTSLSFCDYSQVLMSTEAVLASADPLQLQCKPHHARCHCSCPDAGGHQHLNGEGAAQREGGAGCCPHCKRAADGPPKPCNHACSPSKAKAAGQGPGPPGAARAGAKGEAQQQQQPPPRASAAETANQSPEGAGLGRESGEAPPEELTGFYPTSHCDAETSEAVPNGLAGGPAAPDPDQDAPCVRAGASVSPSASCLSDVKAAAINSPSKLLKFLKIPSMGDKSPGPAPAVRLSPQLTRSSRIPCRTNNYEVYHSPVPTRRATTTERCRQPPPPPARSESYPATHSAPTSPPQPDDVKDADYAGLSAPGGPKGAAPPPSPRAPLRVPHYENVCAASRDEDPGPERRTTLPPQAKAGGGERKLVKSLPENVLAPPQQKPSSSSSSESSSDEDEDEDEEDSPVWVNQLSPPGRAQARAQEPGPQPPPPPPSRRPESSSIPKRPAVAVAVAVAGGPRTQADSGHHAFKDRLAALGKLRSSEEPAAGPRPPDPPAEEPRPPEEQRHSKYGDSLEGKARGSGLKYPGPAAKQEPCPKGPRLGLPSPGAEAPQGPRGSIKCPASLNLAYSLKPAAGPHHSPSKGPPKSPSKPCQGPSAHRGGARPPEAPRYSSKSEERAKAGGRGRKNPTYGDSLPPPPPRPPSAEAEKPPPPPPPPLLLPPPPPPAGLQSAIEQKVMKGIEENVLKLQEQDRGGGHQGGEPKTKASNGIASWFGLKKSKLPALRKAAEGGGAKGKDEKKEWKINIPSVGRDPAKVASRCREGVEGLNISTLMEKAEGLRRALEEERAYVERSGRGHSCEVVMDQAQGQLAVMYRGGRSDNFMQQLLNRVDGKDAVGLPQRRLSFDCKTSKFSLHGDGEKGPDRISKITSDENLAESVHGQHFTGSGASTYTLDSGIGTFPLPDCGGAAGRGLSRTRADHRSSGSPGRAGRRARTLDRELTAPPDDAYAAHKHLAPPAPYGSALEGRGPAGVLHEDKDGHGAGVFSPRSKTWTFPSLKTPCGPAEVYLAVEEEEEEEVSFGSAFRGSLKAGGPSSSRGVDPGSLPLPAQAGGGRRAKARGPGVPEVSREAGLELLRERPEEALSPSRPQVLETPESLSDSLYDSLSSCGSQG